MDNETGRGGKLRPDDWKSGDRLWLVELVAPFATPDVDMPEVMLGDLMSHVFKGRKIKAHSFDHGTQQLEIREITG